MKSTCMRLRALCATLFTSFDLKNRKVLMILLRRFRSARNKFSFRISQCAPSAFLLRYTSTAASSVLKTVHEIRQNLSAHRVSHHEWMVSAKRLLGAYSMASDADQKLMFTELSSTFGVDHSALRQAIDTYNKNELLWKDVNAASHPRYFHLFQAIGNVEGGVKRICDMRAKIVDFLNSADLSSDESAALRSIEGCLRELLTLWFCLSNLELRRLTWQSPADILHKVMQYEAVHPVEGLSDIQRRLGPHRRCFVFMHEAMPREPLVVVHVALVKKIADSIQDIIKADQLDSCESGNNTAIYYSISSTQPGLRGIDLGNLLIKRVVSELERTDPHIHIHSTLSPIPFFRPWLLRSLKRASKDEIVDERLKKYCANCSVFTGDSNDEDSVRLFLLKRVESIDPESLEEVREVILHLAARYLYEIKGPSSIRAFDPVANFHLRNGAEIYRLNWKGDISARGLNNSFGIMVNYRYRLENVSSSIAQYVREGKISANELLLNHLWNSSFAADVNL